MLKGKPPIKKKSASATANTEKLRKKVLDITAANIARIEAEERGEKPKPDAKVPAKGGKAKTAKPPKAKRVSGLDAAAKVLVESKEPLGAQDIVKAMASKGYWKSPGGKTPHATVYAAMVREIKEKGKTARFKKVDRGMFAANK